MKAALLPHSFKLTGLILVVLSFITPLIWGILEPTGWEAGTPKRKIFQAAILIGFVLILLAREKVEDEFINFCRLRAFRAALLTGLVYFLLDYIGVFRNGITKESFGLMLAEVLVYLAVFYISKTGIEK